MSNQPEPQNQPEPAPVPAPAPEPVLPAPMTSEEFAAKVSEYASEIARISVQDPTGAAKLNRELQRLLLTQGARLQKETTAKLDSYKKEASEAAHSFFLQMEEFCKVNNLPAFRITVIAGLSSAHSGSIDEELSNGSRFRWMSESGKKTRASHARGGELFLNGDKIGDFKNATVAVEELIKLGKTDKDGKVLSLTAIAERGKNIGQPYDIPATTVLKNAGYTWLAAEEATV